MTAMGANELESARVTRVLRDDIVLGRRLPGARLVERDIAAELHVSRLPVREAIRTLANEGIVVVRPRSWAIVRQITAQDVREYAEVRSAIETQLFILAAQRHDERGIAGLRDILDREEQAARAGDIHASRAAAGAFHEYMALLAGNEMFVELVSIFGTRLKWVFGLHSDLEAMAVEHRALFDAIAARDVALVTDLLARHMAAGTAAAEARFGGVVLEAE
ncbi:GntR family transcriptional regulator [Microbacterium sp.]|uniref:GntR family transcriptional regulator n=1 Tax=Microbacterium sp. TaxID=51671 RepID=UPI0026249C28|nr:GntR family transcriptional regulator [Microbacterium sp.]